MKIELIGIPGSGKTSAALVAAERIGLQFSNVEIRDVIAAGRIPKLRMGYERFGSAVRFPKIVAGGIRTTLSTGRRELLGASLTAARRSKRLEACSSGMFDEGPRHGLAAFIARNERLECDGLMFIEHLRSRLPKVDVCVWVKCAPDIAWSRYQARSPEQNFSARGEQDLVARLDRYNRAASLLVDGELVVVDSSYASSSEVAERIVGGIAGLSDQF